MMRTKTNPKLSRKDVPAIPTDAIKRDLGPNRLTDVYDAVLDRHHCRWRCTRGKKYPLVFIRYAYSPQAEPHRTDFPWQDAYFSKRYKE